MGMRYREGVPVEQLYSESEGLLNMRMFTVVIGLLVGVLLVGLGIHGRQIWLIFWGGGLVVVSVAYIAAALLGFV
jgi:hypothetical protein